MFNNPFNYPIPEKTGKVILGVSRCFQGKTLMTDSSVIMPRKVVMPLRIKTNESSANIYYIPKNSTTITNNFGHISVYDFDPTYRIDNPDPVIGDEIKLITVGERIGYPLRVGLGVLEDDHKTYGPRLETIQLTREIFNEIMKTHKIAHSSSITLKNNSNTVESLLSGISSPIGQMVASALNLKVYGSAIVESNNLQVSITDKDNAGWLMNGPGEYLVFDGESFKIISDANLDKYEDQVTALFCMGYYPRLTLCIPKGYIIKELVDILGFELEPYHFKIRDIILDVWKEIPNWMKVELFTEEGNVVDLTDMDHQDIAQDLLTSMSDGCRERLNKHMDLDKQTKENVLYHLQADDGFDTGIYVLGTGESVYDGLSLAFFNGDLSQAIDLIKGHDEKLEMFLKAVSEY